jgi:nucleoside-diphosphate-sugar epimerase
MQMSEAAKVLVTGGSGYIGGWCIAALLGQEHSVRTTVRDLAREASVRAGLAKIAPDAAKPERLSFHAADLTADAGWDAAAQGCDYVLHVASPLGVAEPKNPDELIVPAREGAKRAVGAAIKAGVKRVVLTSSVAATRSSSTASESIADETQWSDLGAPGVSAYIKSKTLAERAAWDLIRSANGKTELATVNPALVLGPVFSRDFSDSVQVIQRLLRGKMPGIPRLGFNVVDVRDVADLHLRAMTHPAAAGERFIAANKFAWFAELADLLRAKLGADAAKVPTRRAPDFLVRLAALFDHQLDGVLPGLGKKRDYSSAKAQRLLGWTPRPLEDTVIECARSLIAAGAV